jgi:hypothetical protein
LLLESTVATDEFCQSLLCYHCNDIVVVTGRNIHRYSDLWPVPILVYCSSDGGSLGAEEPCDVEPARAQVDKLRILNFLPFFRLCLDRSVSQFKKEKKSSPWSEIQPNTPQYSPIQTSHKALEHPHEKCHLKIFTGQNNTLQFSPVKKNPKFAAMRIFTVL